MFSANMEITIASIERIKPSSPTPPHLNSFKLSFLDQVAETVYTPLLFFYSKSDNNGCRLEKSRLLKESLSAFLTHYYPLAGRLNRNISVDCNDEGVYYSEAEAAFPLLEVLTEPSAGSMKRLMPPEPKEHDPLFLVQVTFFSCGGLSIGVCISHKLCDGAAIATVITGWAESARGSHACVAPLISLSSIFPPIDQLSIGQQTNTSGKEYEQRVVSRRYVFDASSVVKLKAMAASEEVPYPSRVEAVSALIWKCTMKGLRSKKSGSHKPHGVIWPINLRARLKPQLSSNSLGNVIVPMIKESIDESEGGEIELCKLVGIMRRSIVEINEKYKRELRTDELAGLIFNSYTKVKEMGDMEFQAHSSWCRFPLYEADFGWGEPVWVTLPYMIKPGIVVLIDSTEIGGVEVWVSLTREDVLEFDHDRNLLEFASLNPSVLYN